MTEQVIDKIIDETVFSMEVEGFILPNEEKVAIREVLAGNVSFSDQLQIYIDNAKHIGGILSAQRQ